MPHSNPERLPAIPPEQWTDEQKKVAAAIAAGPRGEVRGPFLALLRSPGLAHTVQQVGEYLRFKSPLDRRIAEMATLIAARHWTQQYEWQSHHKHAMKAGLSPAIAEAIAEGRRPTGMAADEEALYDMLTETLHNQSVCDVTYERAKTIFGEQGVIELIAVAGYYAMLAMVLNVARKALPSGQEPMLPWFPH
ncbi:MAG: carboxymuconolactone decarboxylase family protein [Betaproteobacteria bacterium]|nr:carboxymuconolactone decarboxylase family protein [Betaproteobacteria bacterium]MDH4294473.1 carboxymuconolactone decarboxylase family protein [Betaproteobacteria bacterium]MDH5341799.1 carboxymuconolactone decarboxylase family protein [Betaproteobacteria bacterium]